MARKPREKAPVRNLCLDIPLSSPPPAWSDLNFPLPPLFSPMVVGIDPASKDGSRDGMAIMARKDLPLSSRMTTSTLPDVNDVSLSWDRLKPLLADYRARMDALTQAQFMTHFATKPYSSLHAGDFKDILRDPRYEYPRAEDLGCVDALFAALRDQGYDYVGMDTHVADWRHHDARFLNTWIFGPRGEFTGFARVKALDKTLMQSARLARRGEVFPIRLEGYPAKVNFKVTLLHGLQDIANWRVGPYGRPEIEAYCQFATYADYAAWEHLAAYDRTNLNDI